jgi:hypothetical protein
LDFFFLGSGSRPFRDQKKISLKKGLTILGVFFTPFSSMSSPLSSQCQYCKTTLRSSDSVERHQRLNKRCIKLRTELEEQQTQPQYEHHAHTSPESEAAAIYPAVNASQQEALQNTFNLIFQDKLRLIQALRDEVQDVKNSCIDPKYVEEAKRELTILIDHCLYHLNTVATMIIRDGTFNPLRGKAGRSEAENKVVGAYFLVGVLKLRMKSERHRRMIKLFKEKIEQFARVPSGFNVTEFERLHSQWNSILPSEEGKSGEAPWRVGPDVRIQSTEAWAIVFEWLAMEVAKLKMVVLKVVQHPIPVADLFLHVEDMKQLHTLLQQKHALLAQAFASSYGYGQGTGTGSPAYGSPAYGYGYGAPSGSQYSSFGSPAPSKYPYGTEPSGAGTGTRIGPVTQPSYGMNPTVPYVTR